MSFCWQIIKTLFFSLVKILRHQVISKIIFFPAFSLRVITVMSEKIVTNNIRLGKGNVPKTFSFPSPSCPSPSCPSPPSRRLSTYSQKCVIWSVTIFSDITVMTRDEKAGERIIFERRNFGKKKKVKIKVFAIFFAYFSYKWCSYGHKPQSWNVHIKLFVLTKYYSRLF